MIYRSTVLPLLLLLSITLSFSVDIRSSLRTKPTEPHHQQFYQDVSTELKKLTNPIRKNQPIDKDASYLKDFSNKAIQFNRGLNKARLHILQHKKELDSLLKTDLLKIQEDNDMKVEQSKEILINMTNATKDHLEELQTTSNDEEIQSRHNTTRLKRRQAELKVEIPLAKRLIPDLKAKVRSTRLANIVGNRHLEFQKHELIKMMHVSQVAQQYTKGFANPPEEAMVLSKDIARTGLAAMRAPAEASRLAEIRMIEHELTVLSNLRSALAKDEAIVAEGVSFTAVVEHMHRSLEGALPGLEKSRQSRLAMFNECTGRGGSTLVSGESACKELLVLHTPELFRKHLNAVLQEQQQQNNDALLSKDVGAEILTFVDPNATAINKKDILIKDQFKSEANNVRFARLKRTRLLAKIKKGDEKELKSLLHEEATDVQIEEENIQLNTKKEDDTLTKAILSNENPKREKPGSIMGELAKIATQLKQEDPEGEHMAEAEEDKLTQLEQAEKLMSASKPAAKKKKNDNGET